MTAAMLIRAAAAALGRNRLRTGLTMLSLIVGVAAVITVLALGHGAHAAVEADIMSTSPNLVVVSAGNLSLGGVRFGMGSSSRLTVADADAIAGTVTEVLDVSPRVQGRFQIINAGRNWSATVEGVSSALPRIRHWPLAAGAFFGPDQVEQSRKVCVLGAAVSDMLFDPGTDPIGRLIRIGPQPFRVVGVLAPKGQAAGGADQDDTVYVPYTTAQKRLLGVASLRNVLVSAATIGAVGRVANRIRLLLRARHRIGPGEPDDFRVRTLQELVELRTRTMRTFTMLLSGVAAVSLLVAGVGVMNIMLVSVTERTREIGLRLSVGARQRDVLRQFLVEAGLLSAIGGLLGIATGGLLSHGLTGVIGWPTLVDPGSSLATCGLTAAIGVFFGWYPARRAAAIDPIDAIRCE